MVKEVRSASSKSFKRNKGNGERSQIGRDLSGGEDNFPLEDKTIRKLHMGAHGS